MIIVSCKTCSCMLGITTGWMLLPNSLALAAKQIKEEFGGELPASAENLLSFYGVGQKTMMVGFACFC